MKHYLNNICTAIVLACFVVSCDLNTLPTDALETEKGVFKNAENTEHVFRGTWSYLFKSGSDYASLGLGSIMLNDDFAGSDVVRTLSYGYQECYSLMFGYGRGTHNTLLWDLMYDPINNCNAIIKHIDNASGTIAAKNLIKGKTLATRGFLYMMLASHYSFSIDKDPNAVCVPIYTEPTDYTVATNGGPAASVSEVYQQALSDLEGALELIPEGYTHGNDPQQQYVPDRLVTLGLLARTNLYARNWQKAYDYAVAALAINSYLMNEAEYKGGFNDYTNKEWMWAFSATIDDNSPCYLFYFKDATTPGSFYTNLNTDPWFKAMFKDEDYRKDLFNWGKTSYGDRALLNSKFKFKDISNLLADIVLMRTSEMYLIKAESAAHLAGKETEAQQTLQTLRQARMKSGATVATVTETGDELIKEIWVERRKELWGEGFALTDIIRNQQTVTRKDYSEKVTINGSTITLTGHSRLTLPDLKPFEPNSKYYLFRIPESEELQNKNLYSNYAKSPIYDK